MITLDLDNAVLECATGTALLLKLLGQQLELINRQRHTGDQGYALALAALGFTPDTHDSITFGLRLLLFLSPQPQCSKYFLHFGQIRPDSLE